MNAAQKRQIQRDDRRRRWGRNRNQGDERRERERKKRQAKRRGRDRVDPYASDEGLRDFPKRREQYRFNRCRRTGRGCGYTADLDTTKKLLRRERRRRGDRRDGRYTRYGWRLYDDDEWDDYEDCRDECEEDYDDDVIETWNELKECYDDCYWLHLDD